MTPKEKAKELFNKFCYAIRTEETDSGYFTNVLYAKDCALIAVDEIIESRKEDSAFDDRDLAKGSDYYTPHPMYFTYWIEVKHELNKSK